MFFLAMNAPLQTAMIASVSLLATAPVRAQGPAGDHGVLVIRNAEREVGGETFEVDPGTAGYRITVRAVYTAVRPATEFTASLDRGPGTELAFQLSRRSGATGGQIYVVQKRNRLTVRQVGRGAERASELPGGPGIVVLSDSVFSLYLQIPPLATPAGVDLTAIFPQDARSVAFTARHTGPEAPAGVIRLSGGIEGEIELGNAGEVLRISIPAIGLEARRRTP